MVDKISLRDLTTQLENGDAHNVTPFFQGKFEEERFKDLEAIRNLNEQDKAAGRTTVTLHCGKGFYYGAGIDITSSNGAWDEFAGGKLLYHDSMTLRELKHSDPADTVPSVRQPIDVRKLTDAMEQGDGNAVKAALDGKYAEERAQILLQAETINRADVAAGKTAVKLEISLGGPKYMAGSISVVRTMPGAHDWWMGGKNIYYENIDATTGEHKNWTAIDTRK